MNVEDYVAKVKALADLLGQDELDTWTEVAYYWETFGHRLAFDEKTGKTKKIPIMTFNEALESWTVFVSKGWIKPLPPKK